jgi:hypothetical protein
MEIAAPVTAVKGVTPDELRSPPNSLIPAEKNERFKKAILEILWSALDQVPEEFEVHSQSGD